MIIRDAHSLHHEMVMDDTILADLFHSDYVKGAPMNASIAHAIVRPGERTRPHRLKASVEVYYILHGRGTMHVDDETREVWPNLAVYIPPGSVQYIENPGEVDLVFLAIVDPKWTEEDEEVLER